MKITNNEEPQRKNRRPLWLLVFITVILLIMLLVLLLLRNKPDAEPEPTETPLEAAVAAQLGQLDGKSEDEIQAELDRIVGEGMFNIQINGFPSFKDGTSEGSLEIENTPNNHYAMDVIITLDDTGEQVYESGLLDPNYHIQSDTLDVDLDAGEYPATAMFYAYDVDTHELVGSTGCGITIYVLN